MNTNTLKEIARRAGVSEPTVSRVINKKIPVTKFAHQKILEIAEEIGYQPNHFAQSLKRGKTNLIGIANINRDREALGLDAIDPLTQFWQ